MEGFRHWAPMECLSLDHFEIGDCSFLVEVGRGTRKIFCEYTKYKTVRETVKKLWKTVLVMMAQTIATW